jgi:hypothetical protein
VRHSRASGPKRDSSAQKARRNDLLGRRIGADANPTQPTCLSVYDGRFCIGFVTRRRDGFEALDAKGDSLGIFTSIKAAAHAVSAAGMAS